MIDMIMGIITGVEIMTATGAIANASGDRYEDAWFYEI
jgi:hypothetical protein